MTRILPVDFDISRILAEAKRQLKQEADYEREAQHLLRYRAAGGRRAPDLRARRARRPLARSGCSPWTASTPARSRTCAAPSTPQALRDEFGTVLQRLMFRELFEFRFVQTDPNFANYLFEPESGRLVLLDFGSAREYPGGVRGALQAALPRHGGAGPRRGPRGRRRDRLPLRRRNRGARQGARRPDPDGGRTAARAWRLRLRRIAARGARARGRLRPRVPRGLPAPTAARRRSSCTASSAEPSCSAATSGPASPPARWCAVPRRRLESAPDAPRHSTIRSATSKTWSSRSPRARSDSARRSAYSTLVPLGPQRIAHLFDDGGKRRRSEVVGIARRRDVGDRP